MCEMNLRLVIWMDGELPGDEAAAVEQHVQACASCRQRVSDYRSASSDFATYYSTATQPRPKAQSPRKLPRWIPFAAAAAVVVTLLMLPRAKEQAPPAVPAARVITPLAIGPTAATAEQAQPTTSASKRRPAPRRSHLLHEDWAIGQPAIQIAIPAEAMFPPGAVPEGIAYIANVSFAPDGSVQGFRLQQ